MLFISHRGVFERVPESAGYIGAVSAVAEAFVFDASVTRAYVFADVLGPIDFAADRLAARTFIAEAWARTAVGSAYTQHVYISYVVSCLSGRILFAPTVLGKAGAYVHFVVMRPLL